MTSQKLHGKKPLKKSASSAKIAIDNGINLLQIENNVPLPERGMRDPEFHAKATELLSNIKVKQSFVVPKNKAFTVKKLGKSKFENMVLRSALIKPHNQFVRVWRVK